MIDDGGRGGRAGGRGAAMVDAGRAAGGPGSGISRRDAIKRAAIAGGVVAWTVPTVQVLGSGTAFAQTAGTPIGPCESVDDGGMMMMGMGTKPTSVTMSWLGGTCASFPDTSSKGSCVDAGGGCGDANQEVRICVTTGGTITGVTNGSLISGCARGTAAGGLQFTFTVTANDVTFQVSRVSGNPATFTLCQTVVMHMSCSDTPPVEPGYRSGGLLLHSWS